MNRIKELNEKRGAKLKEASAIVNKARDEKRELTGEENQKVSAIHTEVESIDSSLSTEIRQAALEGQRAPQLTKGEQRAVESFDYAKLLNHLDSQFRGGVAAPIDGVEREMLAEGILEARNAGVSARGIVLPRALVRRAQERRDMTATGTTSTTLDQGGMTIATQKAGLLDDFFNASVARAAGATVLEGLQGNLDIPRLVAGTAGAKKAENAASDEVTPTTAMLSLQPRRLPAYIDISQQLLKQSSSAIEAILRSHCTAQMAAVQEVAIFHGGGTNEPTGVAATSGIGSVAGGTNGLAPAWTHFTQLEEKVDAQNALLGNLAYISNGQIRKKIKETPKVSSTDSMMILDDRAGSLLNGYRNLWTNAVSRGLTKGTSSGVCSAIFFGNWSDLYIAYWGGIELELVRDKTNAISGLYTLVANTYYDAGVVRPKSFAAMLDALGA